jgi:hypothetical protein
MRTLAVAAITSLIALAVASMAAAAPSVSLVWTDTTGGGTTGGSSIDAVAGDTLTLDIVVTPDANNVSLASVSLDISVAGTTDLVYRSGVDSINDGLGGVFFPSAGAATNTGGGLTLLSAATCPFPATGNTLGAGACGDSFGAFLSALNPPPADLGGGIIGSFAAATAGSAVPNPFTIGRATFLVVPEPATGGLLALGLGALALIGRRRS